MKSFLRFALILAALAAPAVAQADTPSGATPSDDEMIVGLISSFSGKYGLTVRNDRGDLKNVTLHPGTAINPTGLQLKPGMLLTIVGHAAGRTFDANKIDAPVEAANRSNRSADGSSPPKAAPVSVPQGTFQTNGPSAVGGG